MHVVIRGVGTDEGTNRLGLGSSDWFRSGIALVVPHSGCTVDPSDIKPGRRESGVAELGCAVGDPHQSAAVVLNAAGGSCATARDVRGSVSLSESLAANLRSETRTPQIDNSVPRPPANGPPSRPAATARAANAARFITANPTERRIDLGADGRLPELVLQEGAKSEPASATPRATNPLVLIAVLAVSFGLTAAMLLLDTESKRSESDRKAEARDELALHYTHSHRRLEPYQEQLRQALQFHNQGKYAEERNCYRRVLDLLHEEHRENLKGLTGVRHGVSPPSDEHLESLLSQLLSNDG